MKHFRASPEIAAALAKAAEREGVSQSEIIRRALAGRLGVEAASPPLDPFERLAAAARGELQAQRDLANEGVRLAFDPESGMDPDRCLREALIFARMAATHGDVADQGLIISIVALLIGVAGDHSCEDEIAEALARVAIVDEAGAEVAAAGLQSLIDGAPKYLVEAAMEYRSRIRDEVRSVVA